MKAREVALKVINDVTENGAYANLALNKVLVKADLSDIDRRFVTELVYGTVKAGNTLDWMISHYLSRPFSKVHYLIRNILRLGAYQLFFLSKVPASAACNETVNLAKKYGHQGTVKFVNAVMRSMSRQPEKIVYPDVEKETARYLSLKYFYPQWIVDRWLSRLGYESCQKLLEVSNGTPHLCFRTNTLKTDRESLLALLKSEGVVCHSSSLVPEGIICTAVPSLSQLNTLKQGLFQIQDESSMLVGHVLDPRPGDFVIDACAAPGGKSTHIGSLMEDKGTIMSFDIHDHKIKLIEENLANLGISIIRAQQLDATRLHEIYKDKANRVLVDAPCSGLGVLRRRPDARWNKSIDQLKELPVLQRQILNSAAACVKPGGILVYSTCTTEREENQDIINTFLNEHKGFVLEHTGDFLPVKRDESMVQLWPHIDDVDGFFIARMKRLEVRDED